MKIQEWTFLDALNIASVHIQCWRETYHGIISDEYLNNLNVLERSKKWETILADPNQKVFISSEWERIIWFATCWKSDEIKWYDSSISSIYLLTNYEWMAIWRNLFHTCTNYLKSFWYKKMYVWVLESNPAKHFYRKMGGEFICKNEVEIWWTHHIEEAYWWDLI